MAQQSGRRATGRIEKRGFGSTTAWDCGDTERVDDSGAVAKAEGSGDLVAIGAVVAQERIGQAKSAILGNLVKVTGLELADQFAYSALSHRPLRFRRFNIILEAPQHRLEGHNVFTQHNCAAQIGLRSFEIGAKRHTIRTSEIDCLLVLISLDICQFLFEFSPVFSQALFNTRTKKLRPSFVQFFVFFLPLQGIRQPTKRCGLHANSVPEKFFAQFWGNWPIYSQYCPQFSGFDLNMTLTCPILKILR
ncbi:protein of unknown function (plasmid) [Cupriavidus taiwanensis]|uniref:Uncharacterized protein n=1 Tax=Cupriavidus taiwanensis TaxID=164546 RepID=A0A7Z7NP04_9BURK|nr:protein of unknown function [Cupriavidus taiwanensis]SOZ12536.1 protein of unknown function [Cupriavidus taiwanensis]SOZ43893.1 protein of unknown function [Cupriavidus taiwanensis]SPC23084.1 protein of unknown function [Cupriavidus taiwanensis]SPD54595.1 protein of unknown function [Cupriavidus taiwanensis]